MLIPTNQLFATLGYSNLTVKYGNVSSGKECIAPYLATSVLVLSVDDIDGPLYQVQPPCSRLILPMFLLSLSVMTCLVLFRARPLRTDM